jgi:transcription elongation factor GreA-like protein
MSNPRLAKIKKDRNCPTEIGKEYRELGITHQDWNEWSQKSSSKQQ